MKIQEKVFDILRELSGEQKVKLENNLQTDMLLDSLGMVTLLIIIEDDFGVELDESDMNPFDLITVNDVVALVKKYVEEADE